MNDTQFFEAARVLAEQAYWAASDGNGRIDFLSRRLLSRFLDDKEREIAVRAYQDYLRYYDANPRDARKLLGTGEAPQNPRANAVETAALAMLANQMFNLDEVLTK
ncbi:MAG: hypothetical protein IPM24_00945 [Bryobacterales bacterium]|nr:hypothetical protein [Bryobacterales bacterium]